MPRKDQRLARSYHRLLLQIMCFYVWIFLHKKQCLVPTFQSTNIREVSSWSWGLGWKGQKKPASCLSGVLSRTNQNALPFTFSPGWLSTVPRASVLFSNSVLLLPLPEATLPTGALTAPTLPTSALTDSIQTMPSPVPAGINPHPPSAFPQYSLQASLVILQGPYF